MKRHFAKVMGVIIILATCMIGITYQTTSAQSTDDGRLGILLTLSSDKGFFSDDAEVVKNAIAPSAWYGGSKGSFVTNQKDKGGEAFYLFDKSSPDLKEHYKLKYVKTINKNGYYYAIFYEVGMDGTEWKEYQWALPDFFYPSNIGLPAYHKRPGYSEFIHSFVYVTKLEVNFLMTSPRK
jgi:hypothetical protein